MTTLDAVDRSAAAPQQPQRAPLTTAQQQLRNVQDTFIRRWGEMGQTWGINRTMAEIHALLYICAQPLCTDDVMERLNISRGNASMSLRALVDWGIIRRVHKRGERREYFESLGDVWEMFTLVASQRKRREIDPILNTLRRCREDLSPEVLGDAAAREPAQQRFRRVNELLKFLSLVDSLAQRFFESHRSLREAIQLLANED